MNKVTPSTDRNTIAYWAERRVMSNAVDSHKSWKKSNYFYYDDAAVATKVLGISVESFVAERNAYIKNNPMKFSPSTKTLWRQAA